MKITTKNFTKESGWDTPLNVTDKENLVILVFGNDESILIELKTKYIKAHIAGCSTSGQINGMELTDKTTCTFIELEKTKVKSVYMEGLSYKNSFEYGANLINNLNSSDLVGMLLFTEGLDVNGMKLAEGIASINNKVKVAGGTAGDNLEFKQTWVYANGRKINNGLVALAFYGDSIVFNLGSESGINPIGVEKKITKSIDNVIYTIDDKPALDLYLEWFKGESVDSLGKIILQCPVEISSNFSKEEGLVRTPIQFSEKDRSITYTGAVPEGKYIRLMRANVSDMVEAAEAIIFKTWGRVPEDTLKNKEILNLLVSCSARKAVLQTEVEDEFFMSGKESRKTKTTQVGFYSYGEFNRVNEDKGVEFLNQTMTIASIYEK